MRRLDIFNKASLGKSFRGLLAKGICFGGKWCGWAAAEVTVLIGRGCGKTFG